MITARILHPLHAAGLALVTTLSFWIALSAGVTGSSPWAMLSVVWISSAAYTLARLSARYLALWTLPAAVVGSALALVIASPAGAYSHLSAAGFLGYSNAKAAFFVQAAFAALIVFARHRSWKVGALLLPALVAFVAVPIYSRSLGAFLVCLLLVPGAFVTVFRRGHRPVMILAIALVAVTFVSSLHLSRAFSDRFDRGLELRIASLLDYGRALGWGNAYEIMAGDPLFGAGPGMFEEEAWITRRVPDLRWAHNEFLQQGAETGVVGLALLLTLVAWTFMRLSTPVAGSSTVAALAVAALATHACAEYMFHFPLLPAITASLVGSTPLRGPAPVRGRRGGRTVDAAPRPKRA